MKTYMKKGIVMLPLVALLAACGSQSGANSGNSKGTEPPVANKAADINEKFKETVTVNFFYNGYSGSLMDEWKAKIKEKYNIELNPYMKETIESLIASGVKLDLIAYSAGGLFKALDLQLTSDMSDMIAKYKFDLNRLAPGVLESARMYSGKGEVQIGRAHV